MVPEGWSKTTVSEICTLKNGHGFKPEEWDTEGLPIIRIQNLNGGANFNFYSGVPEKEWLVEHGQMLFAWAGTKGVSFGPTIWRGPKGVLNQHIFKVFPARSIDRDWLYYCLRHVTNRIERGAHGFKATLVHVKKSEIDSQVVLLPPPGEQIRIAEILSTWDCAIDTVEKLIENSEKQKKALAHRLLTGQERIPGYTGVWEVRTLGSLFSERREANRPMLRLLSITAEKGVISQDEVGRRNTSNDDKSKYKRICPGDIGYNTMRMWQGVSALSDIEGIISPAYTVVTSKGEIDPLYASYLFKLPRTVHDFCRYSQGLTSDTWSLKFPLFARVQVKLPPLSEQLAIAKVLQNIDACIHGLKRQLEHLQNERAALMQQLLTGKRRLSFNESKGDERLQAAG